MNRIHNIAAVSSSVQGAICSLHTEIGGKLSMSTFERVFAHEIRTLAQLTERQLSDTGGSLVKLERASVNRVSAALGQRRRGGVGGSSN